MNLQEALFVKTAKKDDTLILLHMLQKESSLSMAYLKKYYKDGIKYNDRDTEIIIMPKEYKNFMHLLDDLSDTLRMELSDDDKILKCILKHYFRYEDIYEALNEEQKIACCVINPYYLRTSRDIPLEPIIEKAKSKSLHMLNHLSDDVVKSLTDEQLKILIKSHIENFYDIPQERMNKELLYTYLEKMVRDNVPVIHQDYLKSKNIPIELMDKTYYQCMCMVNGYNYKFIPTEYLSFKLINYSLEHQSSFIGFYHLLYYLPDEYKTEDVCLRACTEHFAAIEHIPVQFQTESFYRKLMRNGQYSFLQYSNIESVPMDIIVTCVANSGVSYLPAKFPKKKWTAELALVAAKSHNATDYVPCTLQSKSFWKEHVAHNGHSISKCPAKYITPELAQLAVEQTPGAVKKIPAEYLSDEFFITNLANGFLYPKDVPVKLLTPEILLKFISNCKYINCDGIPASYYNTDIVSALINRGVSLQHLPLETFSAQTYALIFNSCKTVYEKKMIATKIQYIPDTVAQEIIKSKPDGILALKNPTREQIELSISLYPENIIYFKSNNSSLSTYKSSEAVQEKQKPAPAQDASTSAIPDSLFATITQLSLFELFADIA